MQFVQILLSISVHYRRDISVKFRKINNKWYITSYTRAMQRSRGTRFLMHETQFFCFQSLRLKPLPRHNFHLHQVLNSFFSFYREGVITAPSLVSSQYEAFNWPPPTLAHLLLL